MDVMLALETMNMKGLVLDEPRQSKRYQPSIERAIALLSYSDNVFTMNPLILLTPVGILHAWDYESGRLELDLSQNPIFLKKFQEFQDTLSMLVSQQSHHEQLFYPMLQNTILTVYVNTKKDDSPVPIWKHTTWSHDITANTFTKRQPIQLGIRFQGICFFKNLATREHKYRIQHTTRAIYAVT
jgi:hypothetical protein